MDRAHRDRFLTEDALAFLEKALGVGENEITGVNPAKAGMTNNSFRFFCRGVEYMLRVPGPGTKQLISRTREKAVYDALRGSDIPDRLTAMDPQSGYKLTEYWADSHNCDPGNMDEVRRCMEFLRAFHEKKLRVDHEMDLFAAIEKYEGLMGGSSAYGDYDAVKARCLAMKPFLDSQETEWSLTHVDAVPDNFLFAGQRSGEHMHLIDWEYAGMFDPHLDIAMFAIYAGYDRQMLHQLMEWYFGGPVEDALRQKIYCYTALGGLMWSNWCEYKKTLGADFGAYAESQYRYASEFSLLFEKEMKV